MKTIGYMDNIEGKTIHKFFKKSSCPLQLFPAYKSQKCQERIQEAKQ